MILFFGDSFTWGQGLEWEYLINNEGWDYKKCNDNMPPKNCLERLPLRCQDFREKNHWPRLVSEYFDHQYQIARYGNGGSNQDTLHILDNIEHHIHTENLDCVIIQLTHALRNPNLDGVSTIEEFFELAFNEIRETITSFKNTYPTISVLFISWIPEYSPLIEKYYGKESLVYFNYDGNVYNSFDEFYEEISLSKKYIDTLGYNLIDHHFSLEGHKVIAKNIIDHIKKYNLLKTYGY